MTKSNLDLILFCAFRYALGRTTYVVCDIVDILLENKNNLEDVTKREIKAEIELAISEGTAGMRIDEVEWERVLEAL